MSASWLFPAFDLPAAQCDATGMRAAPGSSDTSVKIIFSLMTYRQYRHDLARFNIEQRHIT